MEVRALRGTTATDRARLYWLAGADTIRPLSPAFRSDVDRFESARLAYRSSISEPFIDRFVEFLDGAVEAGEIAPTNTRFLALVLRQIALVVRDERILGDCGLTATQAMLEIDHFVWNGILTAPARPPVSAKF